MKKETQSRAYWDRIGAQYGQEIFDAYYEDRTGKLRNWLQRFKNIKHFAIDVGCGTGKAFPYLSPLFGHVLGVDISAELLKIARLAPFDNISLKKMDLAVPRQLPPADFAFCCNVAILPDEKKNLGIIRNVRRALKPKGHAIFVVPSLESGIYSGWQLVKWFEREGVSFKDIPPSDLQFFDDGTKGLLSGFMKIDGVPTKHYLETELQVVFTEAGFSITAIEKLEYNWTTEFDTPPKWMGTPYPWDWLVVCGPKLVRGNQ